jgi:outer membrane protein TolC
LAAPGALDEAGAFRFSIGPSINWGIFNLGQVRARIRASDAASEADAAQWQGSLLAAAERATATVRARARARAGAASAFELAEADPDSVICNRRIEGQLSLRAAIPL